MLSCELISEALLLTAFKEIAVSEATLGFAFAARFFSPLKCYHPPNPI
jgi:hypothetical protein